MRTGRNSTSFTIVEKLHSRILALDVGDSRIGVAVSDETRTLARPLCVVERKKGDPVGQVAATARENAVSVVVVGLPLQMDGSVGVQAGKVRMFAARLLGSIGECGIEVVYWDERLSTVEARAILLRNEARKKRRSEPVDAVSASVILQSYLDHLKAREAAGRK